MHLVGVVDHMETWVPLQCNQPHCTDCWQRRMVRARDSMRAQTLSWTGNSWLLTRSLMNQPSFDDGYYALTKAIERWRKNPTPDTMCVHEWIAVWEVKKGRNGWNWHEHRLMWCPEEDRLDYSWWQKCWKLAAQDRRAHLDLQLVQSCAVGYLTSYMSKGLWGGLSIQQAWMNRGFLKGRRFLRRSRGSAPDMRLAPKWKQCCMPNAEFTCDIEEIWRTPVEAS